MASGSPERSGSGRRPESRLAEELRELSRDLCDLGRDLRVPPLGDGFADAVMARVAEEPTPAPRGAWATALAEWARQRWRLLVASLLGGLLVLSLSAPVRATVAQWFGFGGVVVGPAQGPAPSSAPPPPLAQGDLTLAEAERLVEFEPLLPKELGPPDGVEVSADRRVLSMTWSGGPDGVLRLDQFDGRIDPRFYKSLHGSAEYGDVRTELGTGQGLWFPRPHEVVVAGPGGEPRTSEARLAGHTLIWQSHDITLRLEGDMNRQRAVTIAESTR
ncbi:MAG: hypothetical protein GEU94_16810 [Micromonosporaceae bacterium]|nr:hypothetical protein [Micromonosporaceae bacterium]